MSALEELLAGGADWPSIFPERLSPSSIALASSCPEKFRRRYLLGERERWGGAALVGLAVHRAVEETFRHKLEHGELMGLDETMEVAAQAFDDKTVEAEKDGIDWGDVKPGAAKDQSVRLTSAYRTVAAPRVNPVAVEQWVDVSLPGLPDLTGRVDVVADTGILDVKTTARRMTVPKGDWRLKGMVYVLLTGQPVTWHVAVKKQHPEILTPAEAPGLMVPATDMVKRVAEARVRSTAAQLVGFLDRYGPEDRWPTNAPEHDWLCGYCSFRETCEWWAA